MHNTTPNRLGPEISIIGGLVCNDVKCCKCYIITTVTTFTSCIVATSLTLQCQITHVLFPTPVSSTNKADHHHITEILLKVALNTINLKPQITNWIFIYCLSQSQALVMTILIGCRYLYCEKHVMCPHNNMQCWI